MAVRRTAKRPARNKKSAGARPAATLALRDDEAEVLPIDVEGGTVDKLFASIKDEVSHWVNKGRYTKVRFKFRGKPLLPDIPIAAVMAAEAATFWWAGLLRALVVNLGARTMLDVEFVSDADTQVARGKEFLLAGDLDQALAHFEKAVQMDRDCAAGYLNIGVARKLRGDKVAARDAFERAKAIDPSGPIGTEADRLVVALDVAPPVTRPTP